MIRKKLQDDRLILIRTAHYPYRAARSKRGKGVGGHRALIGIGGNIGDVPRRFEKLFWFLKRSRAVSFVASAPILRNPPFGYLDQPDFYNSLIQLQSPFTPAELLRFLLRTEQRFGRKRTIKDGPRTLDLDIIFYDDVSINSKKLTIPHPQWMNRSSVLIPLKYMKGRR